MYHNDPFQKVVTFSEATAFFRRVMGIFAEGPCLRLLLAALDKEPKRTALMGQLAVEVSYAVELDWRLAELN